MARAGRWSGLESFVNLQAEAGTTYVLSIDAAEEGGGDFNASLSSLAGIPNDGINHALPVESSPYQFDSLTNALTTMGP